MARGKLILVIGPMGSGKSTLLRHAVEHYPELGVLNSYTTRARRPDHVENDHYRFVSKEEFQGMIDRGDLLEWAEFSSNFYGTRKQDLEEELSQGKVVIKEMEVQGVRQVKGLLDPEDVLTIFIDAGSWEELVERAMKRDPLSDDELERRKKRFEDEVTFIPEADVVIKNGPGKLEEADKAFEQVIADTLEATK
jgi:guanylate kinase